MGGHVRGYTLLSRRTARTATTLLCLFLGGCSVLGRGFLSPAGPVAAATRQEFLYVCLVLLFVVAPVLLLAPLIAWHYRLSNTRSAYQPQWGFSWPLEGLIWIPPSLIIAGLSVLLWRDTHRLDPYKPLGSRPLEIEAVAMDWKWLFIYPEQNIAMVNRLVVQAGQPVHLRLTSATVMQSILMPRLAGQIYAMAGMCTQLNFAASAPGSFSGENTQFNGFGFQSQKFEVSALDAAGFAKWLASTKAQPNRLDPAAYEVLSRRSTLPHPLAFGAVDPGLFGRIVAMAQPGGHMLALKNLPPAASPMETSQ